MHRPFVVVSGLPGSGKTTVGRHLAAALGLRLIDKDDVLEHLFELKGTGDSAWRKRLSRESDRLFQAQATASPGAVLVSFWHVPGMAADSGTPTAWLAERSACLVHVRCVCPADVAATRFLGRRRHPGHRDEERTEAAVRAWMEDLAQLGPLDLVEPIEVDTSAGTELAPVVEAVRAAFARAGGGACTEAALGADEV